MESQRLLPSKDPEASEESLEDDWTDRSSYNSYSESDSNSTIPDWEPYVDDFSGELFYIDCHPFVTHSKDHNKSNIRTEPFSKSQLRRSTRGKFLRLLRRRESKRYSKKGQKPVEEGSELNTQKVKFQDFQEGEEKVVTLEVDSENRYNLSGDKSLAESLLGLIVSTLSDGSRVMIAGLYLTMIGTVYNVATQVLFLTLMTYIASQLTALKLYGFSYDSKAKHERNIKIGDWLKSINSIDVHVHNLDDILQKFINHNEVILTLQRVAATEVTKDPPINKLNLESAYVRDLLNSNSEDDQHVMQKLCNYPIGVAYLNTDNLEDNGDTNNDLIYHFPRPHQKNVLCISRGIFITLNHLLQDITTTKPRTSSILYKGKLAHIVYSQFEKKLLLLMFPDEQITVREAVSMSSELIGLLQFSFGSLDNCFTNEAYAKNVDRILFRYFAKLLCNSDWVTISQFMEFQSEPERQSTQSNCLFEEVMPVVPTLKLQDDAIMQIDDALSELESSDYREWNEDPLDCQRLFTILGSALFHSGYLLHSHLSYEDLVDVYNFCKHQGLVYLSKAEPVRSLVLWKEIFPRVMREIKVNPTDVRWYLLVIGSGKNFLAVIMEAGGATEPPEDYMGPDAFYVEEAQATLAHIQALGLGVVAERFLLANGGFQVATPLPPISKKKNDFMGSLSFTKHNTPQIHKESTSNQKKSEVISILKRRSSEQNVLNTSNEDSYDAYSEESGSQCYSEGLSEVSDESGGKNRRTKCDSNEDDSDLEDFGDSSQISTSSFDLSEVRQSLISESGDCVPIQLTTGTHNVLYNFVYLDATECVLVTPLDPSIQSQTYNLIMNNFKRCCQNIHGVFQNTLRFKNMPAQDIGKSLMNKSLIAIKEYGMLFECPFIDEKENIRKNRISYWVIGRLFYMPHPKELYVCYQDAIPQNLVELAFKIGVFCPSIVITLPNMVWVPCTKAEIKCI